MQIKPHSEMTRDEAIMLWQSERAENEMLRAENAEQARLLGISAERELAITAQLIEARKIIERREVELEAIGAGGVSAQRITGSNARWYAVGADGVATFCINREDARDTAAEAAQCYPNNAPYTAVQMVPVGEVLGETCIDGGKCHHGCKERCFRRQCCEPFSDYNGPWKYADEPVKVPSDAELEKAWDSFEAEMARHPTDDELEEFMAQFANEMGHIHDDQHAEAARALLARYGQQSFPAAAIAYVTRNEEGDRAMLFFELAEARLYCNPDEEPEALVLAGSALQAQPADPDAERYRKFVGAGLPITYLGEDYHDKASLDAVIDAMGEP